MKQTIYQYVNSHLDEHGRFTATNLCDDRYATIPRPLGSEDAFHYTMGNLPNPKSASILLAAASLSERAYYPAAQQTVQ